MKRFSLILLAVAALALSGAPKLRAAEQPDAQAQSLLQKHRAYVGWQLDDGTFKTLQVTGSVTNAKGKKTESFRSIEEGILFRHTTTLLNEANITMDDGFTGSVFWQSDSNGFTVPVYGEQAKALAAYAMLMDEGTSGLPGTYVGEKTIDGKRVSLVRVTLEHGDPIDLYIDPLTGAYVQAVIDPDGAYEATYHILSYADVLPGKKMIGSYRIDDSHDVHTNDAFSPNVLVSNGDLHPPAATASWVFTSGEPVPIHLTYDRILVDATVNGVKGTFILDTGSDAIRMDDAFADRAHVKLLEGSNNADTLYDTVKERPRRVAEMDFGNASLRNVIVYSQNFERFGYRGLDAKGYAGLIGSDFFSGAIVKLDVYDSKMTILDPSTDLSRVKAIPLLVDLSGGELTVPMTLDKTMLVNTVLDTGNPGSILFSYNLEKKHWPFNPRTLALGPIQYSIGSWIGCCMDKTYALLGFDFLKHFDYIFDYPRGRVFLIPNKN